MINMRIIKRNKKFYIQKRFCFFWIDVTENNSHPNMAFDIGCPPFDSESEARDWLTIYVRFKTPIIYPVLKIAQ